MSALNYDGTWLRLSGVVAIQADPDDPRFRALVTFEAGAQVRVRLKPNETVDDFAREVFSLATG